MCRTHRTVVVIAALLLAACSSADEVAAPSPTPTSAASTSAGTSPTPSATGTRTPSVTAPSPSPSPTPAPPPAPVDGLAEVALPERALPLGLSPDGSAVLVAAPDPDGVRCEEATPYALGLVDVGGDGAVRDASADGGTLPPYVLEPRGDGTALGYAGCEGVVDEVVLVDLADDGTVSVRRQVAPGLLGAGGVSAVAAVPGRDRVAAVRVTGPGTAELVVADLDGTPVGAPEPILSETYAMVATADGRVFAPMFRQGTPEVQELTEGIPFPGYESAGRDADGTLVALAGDRGVAVVEPGVRLDEWLVDDVDGAVRYVGPVPLGDGRVLVAREDAQAGASDLVAVGADGAVEVLATEVLAVVGPTVSRDGDRVLVTRLTGEGVATGVLRLP